MGQAYSFESINPEGYEEVRLSSDGFFGQCSTVQFPFEKKPSNLRDSALWDKFGKTIDQELPKLNKYFGLVLGLIPVVFLCLIAGTVLGATPSILFIFPIFALGIVGGQIWIIQRNQEVDQTIEGICAKHKDRFQQNGIVPEYRTKFTGACKPKGARPLRLLVFKPANAAA